MCGQAPAPSLPLGLCSWSLGLAGSEATYWGLQSLDSERASWAGGMLVPHSCPYPQPPVDKGGPGWTALVT